MKQDNNDFSIDFLDHVAIRVKDVNASCAWYGRVLGLKQYRLPEWGDYPVFMLSGKSGIAIFPANLEDETLNPESKNIRIDHFAFNVTNENFDKAKARYRDLNLDYTFEDHFYFHSIYTRDPDGHKVELTTLVVDEDTFYNK